MATVTVSRWWAWRARAKRAAYYRLPWVLRRYCWFHRTPLLAWFLSDDWALSDSAVEVRE